MKRTADGVGLRRFSPMGIVAGLGSLALGALWLMLHTNPLTLALAPADDFIISYLHAR